MIKPLTLLIGLLLAPNLSQAGIEFKTVVGEVSMTRDGQVLAASPGMAADGVVSIQTGQQGQARLRMTDGTLITLPARSAIQLSTQADAPVRLERGGVDLLAAGNYITVRAGEHLLKSNGFLKLRLCAEGCKELPGLYGRPLSGEVIVEYTGGRSVLRNKPFRATASSRRPTLLAREPDLFTEPTDYDRAARAKIGLAEELKSGMAAFKAGDYVKARQTLQGVLEQSPTEHIVSYYLGLIALELKDNDAALSHLQRFARNDPEGAKARDVNQIVTLLLTNQLQTEVKQALAQEGALSSAPPEPNTIAVQPFSNRSDLTYAALAKGIAAMVITDLSKVPNLKVLERQKVQKLMDEIQLSKSGLVDQEALVRAGRMMRAERVVVGSFGVQ